MLEEETSSEFVVVTLRMQKSVTSLIDRERIKFSAPRSSWITQAVVEKLERLGYEIKI